MILVILTRSYLVAAYLLGTVFFTELVGLRRSGYRTPRTRAFTIATFFISATLLAVTGAGLVLGGQWLQVLNQPLLVCRWAIGAACVGILGWAIGEWMNRRWFSQ